MIHLTAKNAKNTKNRTAMKGITELCDQVRQTAEFKIPKFAWSQPAKGDPAGSFRLLIAAFFAFLAVK